jgi:hypothetical protein
MYAPFAWRYPGVALAPHPLALAVCVALMRGDA